MGDVSDNFDRDEYACKCGCGFDVVDKELNIIHEDLRNHFRKPVVHNSVCRCYSHNEKVQFEFKKDYVAGTSTSDHLYGKGSDTVVRGVSPAKVYQYLDNKYPNSLGLGNAKTFTHIGVRPYRARWSY